MYYGSRGIVGLVKPTYRPGSMESFIKLMPEGVGFIPAHAGVRAGNEKELQEALTVAEKKVARLAELGADVVMIMGAPPTMVRGHGADRQIAADIVKANPAGKVIAAGRIALVPTPVRRHLGPRLNTFGQN